MNCRQLARTPRYRRAVTSTPGSAPRDSVLSRAFRRAIRAQGQQPRFVTKTGTSDMNLVAPVWNCPIVAYGPGDSALDHTPDEHIDLDKYLRAIDVLVNMTETLAPD